MKPSKKIVRLMMLAAVAMATMACNFEDRLVPERVTSDPGRIAFMCDVDPTVSEEITRAESTIPEGMTELPDYIINMLRKTDVNNAPTSEIDMSKLALRIWGTYDDPTTKEGEANGNLSEKEYARAWNSIEAYKSEAIELQRGYYKARIENRPQMANGNIVEGVNNPYFAYETPAQDEFQVRALETTDVTANLKLVNSCFKVQTTQALMDYYTDIELVLHTAQGEFKFNPTKSASTPATAATTQTNTNEVIAWESPEDELYFFNVSEPIKIDAGKSNGLVETPQSVFTSKFKLSGHATKQNGVKVYFTTNGKPDGEPAVLEPTKNGSPLALAAGTMYTLRIGHTTAGSAGLTITYNGYDEESVTITIVELRSEDDENNEENGGTTEGGDSGNGESSDQ